VATDIVIVDRRTSPITVEFLKALPLLRGKAVNIGLVTRARLGRDFWDEHKQSLEAGGFVEVWPVNQTGRAVPGSSEWEES